MKKSFIFLLILSFFTAAAQTKKPNTESATQLELQYREIKQKGDAQATADAAFLVGEAYLQAGNHKRSTDFLLVAKDIYKTQNNSENLAKVSCRLAENYYRTGNTKRYKDYIALAEQLIGKDTLGSAYLLLLDTQIGYFQAHKKHPQVKYLTDRKASLQAAIESQKQPKPQAVTHNQPKPTKPVSVKKAHAKPDVPTPIKKTNDGNIWLALAVAIAALSVGGLIYFFYKDNRRSMNLNRQQHEMRAQLLKNLSLAVRDIASNGQMHELDQQLAQLSEIQAGEKKPNFALEPIGPFLESVTAPFMHRAAQNNIAVISNVEQKSDRELMDKETVSTLIRLLWSEALQHTTPNQTMYFSATVEKRKLELRISYPNAPIDKGHLLTLFDNLYHEPSAQYPNPIGFALTGALVAWYDGKAEATHDGNLLRIVIELPLSEPTNRKPKHVPGLVL